MALAASWSRFKRTRLPTVLVAAFAVVPGAAVLLAVFAVAPVVAVLVAVFAVVPVVAVLVATLLPALLAGSAVALFGVAFTLWPGWTATRGAILILPSARVRFACGWCWRFVRRLRSAVCRCRRC